MPAAFLHLFSPDAWSAIGSVVSAFVAVLNFILVIFLARYTVKTTRLLESQAKDSAIQAQVATATLQRVEDREKRADDLAYFKAVAELLKVRNAAVEYGKVVNRDEVPTPIQLIPENWSDLLVNLIGRSQRYLEPLANFYTQCGQVEQLSLTFVRGKTHEEARFAMESLKDLYRDIAETVDQLDKLIGEVGRGSVEG